MCHLYLSAILAPATAEVSEVPAEEDVSIAAADGKSDEDSSAAVANEANTALDFFSALEEGNVDLVAEMAQKSPDLLEQLTEDGDPPLVIAAYDLDMTKKLLELGANVNSKTSSGGESALFFAEGDVVSVLVEHKIDIDMVNEEVHDSCLCCFVCIYMILLTF